MHESARRYSRLAPFIGLAGTISGIVVSFATMDRLRLEVGVLLGIVTSILSTVVLVTAALLTLGLVGPHRSDG